MISRKVGARSEDTVNTLLSGLVGITLLEFRATLEWLITRYSGGEGIYFVTVYHIITQRVLHIGFKICKEPRRTVRRTVVSFSKKCALLTPLIFKRSNLQTETMLIFHLSQLPFPKNWLSPLASWIVELGMR